MKLITEFTEMDKISVIKEDVNIDGVNTKKYYLCGPVLEAENRNRNGRIYPYEILKREFDKHVEEKVKTNRSLGELNHPANPDINLDRVSHIFTEAYMDGNVGYAKARVLDTPMGKIVKTLIDEKIVLGMSTRGVGSISDDGVVGQDFSLLVLSDCVADPSCRKAFVEGVLENKEWIASGDGFVEAAIHDMKRRVDKKFTNEISNEAINEFMSKVRNNIRGKMSW